MVIDDARCDELSPGIDGARHRARVKLWSYRRDPRIADPDIEGAIDSLREIEDSAALDNDIESVHHSSSRLARPGSDGRGSNGVNFIWTQTLWRLHATCT